MLENNNLRLNLYNPFQLQTAADAFNFIFPSNITPSIKDFCKMAILLSCQPQYKTFNDMAKLIADKFSERFGGNWGVSVIKINCGYTCFNSTWTGFIIQYNGLEYYIFQAGTGGMSLPGCFQKPLKCNMKAMGNMPMNNIGNLAQTNATGEITVKFIKWGITKNIKINVNDMVAELIYKYCNETHVANGTFNFNGSNLDPMDCSTVGEAGIIDGSKINVS